MRHIDSPMAAAELGHEILSVRQRPLVLISSASDSTYAFDPARVAHEIGDVADVVTIETGEVTYALERVLPEKAHVFGGAARSYPPDFGDAPDWWRSVLRFPERHDASELVDDALAQVTTMPEARELDRRTWVTATVELISGATGNVARLNSGTRVMVNADLLPPHIRLEDALVVGASIEGWLAGRDLSPEAVEPDFGDFTDGAITLARVMKVTDHRVNLSLHPLVPEFALRRRDVVAGADAGENAEVRLTDVVRVGETVRARVCRGATGLALSLIDADGPTVIVEPPPLVRGGAAWLREGDHAFAAETGEEQPAGEQVTPATAAVPQSAPPTHAVAGQLEGEVKGLRADVTELRGALARLARDLRVGTDLETLDRLRDETTQLSSELHRERGRREEGARMIARLTQELREARASRESPAPTSVRTSREDWPDAQDWIRHEVSSAWATRVTASEKSRYPVRDYRIGPTFANSLEVLDAAQFAKVMRAVVDVVTGRVVDIPGRELHRLRQGTGGDDPYVVRADGARCWRASIESNVPSARRLHYWELPGGVVELSRVVLHDDFRP